MKKEMLISVNLYKDTIQPSMFLFQVTDHP
jgi:hypothetical protein